MPRVRVDPTKCQGYGTCAEVAESLFVLDDWGYAQSVPRDLQGATEKQAAEAAIEVCPVKAVRLLT
ncbi:ferredoxin [Geodermatophilus ruber]|uniref:Ferredoxin n=1 Tax=Geodermatophilus ruber TaxID=504800 RepID=A0A1I4E265_9ACTN|nr:ferredoxin [Geodermatophilus ruber]SFK98426.1 ferredoxin [Geodermatophilus ruber]